MHSNTKAYLVVKSSAPKFSFVSKSFKTIYYSVILVYNFHNSLNYASSTNKISVAS
jgi:hypothetical protein